LGLTERQFWNSTPREISAFYRILAHKEGRWRFYMATAMGAKHKSGRQLVLADFLPQDPKPARKPAQNWEDQLAMAKAFVMKSKQLRAMAGKVVSESDLKGLIN
jgi:hypothetical protein